MTTEASRHEYLKIRDNCRQGLLVYLAEAFSSIPPGGSPEILDIGCGTGVPAIWLAENTRGNIVALDNDRESLGWLEIKRSEKRMKGRITIVNCPFQDYDPGSRQFDLILAEGFFNVTGFYRTYPLALRLLKEGGHFIIHDDGEDCRGKMSFMASLGCTLINSFPVDEKAWWSDYYRQLNEEIRSPSNTHLADLFEKDRQQIDFYRKEPGLFRSMYYVIRKN